MGVLSVPAYADDAPAPADGAKKDEAKPALRRQEGQEGQEGRQGGRRQGAGGDAKSCSGDKKAGDAKSCSGDKKAGDAKSCSGAKSASESCSGAK